MLFAIADNLKRRPKHKGERATCPHCLSEVIAVIPIKNTSHWRHRAKDCDPWTEPEGEWHLRWKERFPPECREVSLVDPETHETHRADVCCDHAGKRTVVELQHSSISEEERIARESFYGRNGRMFWLLHLHDETSFRATCFGLSLDFGRPVEHKGKKFYLMQWAGSSQFIERWKRSNVHVFFDFRGTLFYLATDHRKFNFIVPWPKGCFLICPLTTEQFMAAVTGTSMPSSLPAP